MPITSLPPAELANALMCFAISLSSLRALFLSKYWFSLRMENRFASFVAIGCCIAASLHSYVRKHKSKALRPEHESGAGAAAVSRPERIAFPEPVRIAASLIIFNKNAAMQQRHVKSATAPLRKPDAPLDRCRHRACAINHASKGSYFGAHPICATAAPSAPPRCTPSTRPGAIGPNRTTCQGFPSSPPQSRYARPPRASAASTRS